MNKIDVIIPVYNGEKWLRQALESVAAQTAPVERIIVVDDGGTDGSIAMADGFPGVQVLRNPQPGSPARARNFGLNASTAPLVAFLDQDDVWHPEHLAMLAGLLKDDPRAAAAAARYRQFHDGEQPDFDLSRRESLVLREWETYPFGGDMEPSLILFRRSVFNRLQWADDMDGCSDRYLFHQLLVHHPVIRSEARSVARRVHGESYYHTMIKGHPLKYFRRLENLSRRLFDYYVRYEHEQRDFARVALRSGIMGHVARIVEAVLARDHAGLQAAAADLEGILSVDNEIIRENTFEQLFVFMTHHNTGLDGDLPREIFYENMSTYWPADCPVTAGLLREKIIASRPGLKFYVGHILRHPLRRRCYDLAGQALRQRWTINRYPVRENAQAAAAGR